VASDAKDINELLNWKLGFLDIQENETEIYEQQWGQFKDRSDLDVNKCLDTIVLKLSEYYAQEILKENPKTAVPQELVSKRIQPVFKSRIWNEEEIRDEISIVISQSYKNDLENKQNAMNEIIQSAVIGETPPPKAPQWNHLPISGELDNHDEMFNSSEALANRMHIIGARVRGKKHKHEGTNCDDWYEFSTVGEWNIIAVSDGAGSKKLSRIGAKVACREAVDYLRGKLSDFRLKPREQWSAEDFARDQDSGAFQETDLEHIQLAIHEAIVEAHMEIERAAKIRAFGEKAAIYEEYLGHAVQAEDLSCTLLLAVHTLVPYKDKNYSLIMTCQVGDGMSAAIDGNGSLQILGIPDTGEFSGETDFVTTKKIFKKEYLGRKTFPFFSPLKGLMVMTDGVADDYYPPNPELARLYEDFRQLSVSTQEGENDRENRSETLRHWLDTYYIRGSFDDRTMVVLYEEE
jgi:hypothetical protein